MRRALAQHFGSAAGLWPRRDDYAQLPRSWRSDLFAGITVGVVALPLALAFGVSSGVGPAAGLVTAVVAGVIAAVFGGSNVQVSGPTGAMAVVLAPIVAAQGVGAVAIVSVLAGIIVLVAGALRLGRVVTFIPWPVVEGFTLGIAAIIFLQQVPAALAVEEAIGRNPLVTAVASVRDAGAPALWSLAAVAVVAVIMVAAPKLHQQLPASLIAVAVVTLVAELADLPLARIGALPDSLPLPVLPSVDVGALGQLFTAALAIAALAAIESLLAARVAASISDTGPYEPDRELVGQGLASIVSGFFGGMPATGAIARTAVNIRAGARTRMASVVHALVILGVIYLATGPVSRIPLAALSGVLMVTAVRMISAGTVRSVLTSTRPDAVVFVVTAIITLAVDLIVAVQIGLVVAAFFALRNVAKAASVHREVLPGDAVPGDERIALFRVDGSMFFGAAERVLTAISAVKEVEVVILRLSQVRMMDATGARALTELITELERRGVTVLIKGVQLRHLRVVTNVGVLRSLRHGKHLFDELTPAVEHARSHVDT